MFVLIAVTGSTLPTNAQRGRAPDRASNFTIIEEVPGSQSPLHLAFVPTKDFIHTPIAMRKPQGDGPFPVVLFLTGNGGGGMARARWAMQNMGYTMERFLEAGYVVAYLRYRGEVPLAYRQAKKLNVRRNTLERHRSITTMFCPPSHTSSGSITSTRTAWAWSASATAAS